MYKLLLFILFIGLVSAQTQPIKCFVATFTAIETQNQADRTFRGRLFYCDTWDETTKTGIEAIRYDIDLNDGVIQTTLTQLEIYQDQYFRYTICRTCSWQDLFAETPLPQLWVQSETPTRTNVVINGVTTNEYIIDQTNVVGTVFDDFVTLYIASGTPRWVVRAVISANGIVKTIDMAQHSTSVPAGAFDVPAGCPNIDPGCFRLDLAFVVDISGSVGGNTAEEKDFVINMINTFLIGPKYLAASLSTFSYCYSTAIKVRMSFNKQQLLADVNAANIATDGGFTCIVGGIQRGFWTFGTVNGSRPATRKAMIVLTDGNGNRPCSNINVLENPGADCQGVLQRSVLGNCLSQSCDGDDVCDANGCCQDAHDCHLRAFYDAKYAEYSPRIYAVGVTSSISDATLQAIVNDDAAIAAGEVRIVRVNNFQDLNSIINSLAAAILCDVPGSESCPNDCRPGGFCCGGSCQCTIDCSTQNTECQLSICRADRTGASCQLGPPDDAACQDPNFQCQDRFCEAGSGCTGTPNNNLPCTDFNDCTIDVCLNGTCTTSVNQSVEQCDDLNQCTTRDACLPNGACRGTADDSLPCSDGNACTIDACVNGTCVSVLKTCPDDTILDCRLPTCNRLSGVCEWEFIRPGFQCAPSDPNDPCTVFVCDDYNRNSAANCDSTVQSCNYGTCVARTRDDDECKGSDDNTAAIIGGVVGGVALLCILLIAAIILLLILCRNNVVAVVGNLNPFGASTDVKGNPAYLQTGTSGTNAMFEG
jgi:hypothetical protein